MSHSESGKDWKMMQYGKFQAIEEICKILYICPICMAERKSIFTPKTPCRLCGHDLMPFWEWMGRKMMREAMALTPIPTGCLRVSCQPHMRGES